MSEQDRNFDDLAVKFQKKIYSSFKGKLRLELLWQDILEQLPAIEKGGMRILDAGAGQGQFALRLLQHQNHVTLCDVSEAMLEHARENISNAYPQAPVEYYQLGIQQLADQFQQPFELVCCHAVLEWLSDPAEAVSQLAQQVKQGGTLSLLFYNRNSIIYRNLLRGNLYYLEEGNLKGSKKSLTPTNPLEPEEIYQALRDNQFEIQHITGVRTFYDYLSRDMLHARKEEEWWEWEMRLARKAPFRDMARYIHVMAKRS